MGTRSAYPLAVAMTVAFLFAVHETSLADDSNDNSRQPDLKSWSNEIPTPHRFVVLGTYNKQAVSIGRQG